MEIQHKEMQNNLKETTKNISRKWPQTSEKWPKEIHTDQKYAQTDHKQVETKLLNRDRPELKIDTIWTQRDGGENPPTMFR